MFLCELTYPPLGTTNSIITSAHWAHCGLMSSAIKSTHETWVMLAVFWLNLDPKIKFIRLKKRNKCSYFENWKPSSRPQTPHWTDSMMESLRRLIPLLLVLQNDTNLASVVSLYLHLCFVPLLFERMSSSLLHQSVCLCLSVSFASLYLSSFISRLVARSVFSLWGLSPAKGNLLTGLVAFLCLQLTFSQQAALSVCGFRKRKSGRGRWEEE